MSFYVKIVPESKEHAVYRLNMDNMLFYYPSRVLGQDTVTFKMIDGTYYTSWESIEEFERRALGVY